MSFQLGFFLVAVWGLRRNILARRNEHVDKIRKAGSKKSDRKIAPNCMHAIDLEILENP